MFAFGWILNSQDLILTNLCSLYQGVPSYTLWLSDFYFVIYNIEIPSDMTIIWCFSCDDTLAECVSVLFMSYYIIYVHIYGPQLVELPGGMVRKWGDLNLFLISPTSLQPEYLTLCSHSLDLKKTHTILNHLCFYCF